MRFDLYRAWPEGYRAVTALDAAVSDSGLDETVHELVKVRVSQLNGCAYCIDMHTKDARAMGETEQRLYATSAWRETPFFTDGERAALALAEALTTLDHGDLDEALVSAREHLGDETAARVVHAVTVMNVWNRLAITSQPRVGDHRPATRGR